MIEIQRRPEPDLSLLPDSIPPILKRIYINRGITDMAQLETSARGLHSYQKLGGIDQAVALLFQAIKEQKRIIVVGDFDADGATSSALSVMALRMLGSANVDYLVPNRFEDGYGLSPEVVDQALELGAEMIMTVDNGVSSIEGVRYAKENGITVLVTDHHLPGQVLPDVDAMVNPNLESCAFPSKALAGVGVAFYLMMALCVHMRKLNWFAEQGMQEPKLMELIDLVALGTVADVVPLDENNRILVHQGLQRIRAGKARPGIQALIEVAKRDARRLVASDFGFALGPRINAAGRLDDMSFGVELLMCNNIHAARRMASELDGLNQTRKEIEEGMKQEAMAFCERLQFGENSELPYGLALFQRDWHQGVIGILASRIKEKFHRPVIAFADGGEGTIKGSCRSIPGLHMRDALDFIDTQNPGLIIKFGGHAMAAGLTIKEQDFERFSRLFDEVVKKELDDAALKGVILSDGELKPEEFSMHVAELLRAGGPFGQAFPEPVFDGEFKVLHQKLVGEKHLKLMLEPLHKGHPTNVMIDGIAFNVDLRRWPDASVKTVRLAYKLDVNEFRGNQSLQLMIDHIEAK
ncbi:MULTISPECIES: single-stranded-DNA-specific exonuclease RecJ [Vibrio]|jgi:single-stranded-DNA-specific exonuclease|uniref:Single-stranded-DNA-specific exonuclease RecJ n=1 Tax=Vibrio natriegens NBRC 15636 = ATCC 14048 = DSM 759 TaxID=1219067 RepID=A0AAN1CUX7_VIBNA|nr:MULTISPECIES: single-stranded-DNA-specific exonuclease RecJ [Vibrio]MEE3878527.1 single-stranded-DNA-specific exonuclease RecJ [Vibrio sp. YYF0003]AEX20960.1 ssDNA exonuclease RecJ [Vibrio sp. EJY3]ALR16458.1 ssDNA exonuclease RecJ [Vibrio natriegens NBRC 15636 = ATCC 14048 = DSM 759]ANQ11676.1 single-stranded-DNA-specific exonuclease RecJ [Vibrio natriegens NBRC 15636 = ATCC 14048 = DSM 759]ANQ20624.1 single-stranded-DNA-specific exonuclease RecJ [Vibrio natriegens]